MTMRAQPTRAELNAELEHFKDRRFTAAQVVNAKKDLERFDGLNIESFHQGLELINRVPMEHFSLLDVGCGIGLYAQLFRRYSRKGIDYSGCDFSQAMIDSAAEFNPGMHFARGDARRLAFADKSFDIVWISALLEHVPEIDLILAEAARVARHSVLLHRLFLHDAPDSAEVITCKATEYPFIEGFRYPRTIRNADEFDRAVGAIGEITYRQPWTFDKSKKQNLMLHSYAVSIPT